MGNPTFGHWDTPRQLSPVNVSRYAQNWSNYINKPHDFNMRFEKPVERVEDADYYDLMLRIRDCENDLTRYSSMPRPSSKKIKKPAFTHATLRKIHREMALLALKAVCIAPYRLIRHNPGPKEIRSVDMPIQEAAEHITWLKGEEDRRYFLSGDKRATVTNWKEHDESI